MRHPTAAMVVFVALATLFLGSRSLAEEEAGCENELLTQEELERSMVEPSQGVEEPLFRVEPDRKEKLKRAAAEEAGRSRATGQLPKPSREVLEMQQRYLELKERIVRSHRGTDEELERALVAAKLKIFSGSGR